MLVEFAGISVFMLLLLLWQIATPILYRHPVLLFVLGVLIGILGISTQWTIVDLSRVVASVNPAQSSHSSQAALIVSVFILAVSGSLIASSVVLQSQKKHDEEMRRALRMVERKPEEYEILLEDRKEVEWAKNLLNKYR